MWQNKLKKEEVRTQEQLVNEKVEKHREEIIKSIQMQNQQKIMGEVAEVERRQKHIEQMEQMESQLLSKLQHTQKRENEVFSQLTGAIREALQS